MNESKSMTLESIASTVGLSEFDRLLATGQRQLQNQQARAISLESEYQKKRTAVIDGFRVRMEGIKIETEEEVRRLDNEHREEMEQINRTISVLKAMRG